MHLPHTQVVHRNDSGDFDLSTTSVCERKHFTVVAYTEIQHKAEYTQNKHATMPYAEGHHPEGCALKRKFFYYHSTILHVHREYLVLHISIYILRSIHDIVHVDVDVCNVMACLCGIVFNLNDGVIP